MENEIKTLIKYTKHPKKKRKRTKHKINDKSINKTITSIQEKAKKNGLKTEEIEQLLNICVSKKFNEKQIEKIIYCLIPISYIGEQPLVLIMSHFTNLNHKIQKKFLEWIAIIIDFIDPKFSIRKFYFIFFHFLYYDSLRPILCYILFKISTRQDVTKFRIDKLLQYNSRFPDETGIIGLLQCYQDLNPNEIIIPISNPKKITILNKKTKKEKSNQIQKNFFNEKNIHQISLNEKIDGAESIGNIKQEEAYEYDMDEANIAHYFYQPDQKLRDLIITTRFNLQFQEQKKEPNEPNNENTNNSNNDTQENPQIIPQIKQVENIKNRLKLQKFHELENLIMKTNIYEEREMAKSIFENPISTSLFSFKFSDATILQTGSWISRLLEEEFLFKKTDEFDEINYSNQKKILKKLVKFSVKFNENLHEVDSFLFKFIPKWNGEIFQEEILSLVSKIKPKQFSDLCSNIFQHLKRLMILKDNNFRALIVRMLTKLVSFWVMKCPLDEDKVEQYYSSEENKKEYPHQWNFLFSTEKLDFIPILHDTLIYFDQIFVAILLDDSKPNSQIIHPILSHYEFTSNLTRFHHFPFVVQPHIVIPLRVLLLPPVYLSRMCSILVKFGYEFEKFKSVHHLKSIGAFENEINQLYNFELVIQLYSDFLWKGSCSKKNLEFLQIPSRILNEFKSQNQEIGGLFSIFGSKFEDYLKMFGKINKMEISNIKNSTIKKKKKYLDFLKNMKLEGIYFFLNSQIVSKKLK
ncbi:centromere protein i [Anaeramoeba ignava]|uniref:Centromere protein i n=1 Tax=Anaeramoeba ignava TaxID=1746090 RepID=A0A9Q0LII3_ANAIG|nr:centromere protein i [Anaeramoeba ignava]